MSSKCVAERHLFYCLDGSSEKKPLIVRVFAPFEVRAGTVNFQVSEGVAGCNYEIDGLPEKITDTCYGADSLQAITLASSAIEPFLKRLQKKYDLFYLIQLANDIG